MSDEMTKHFIDMLDNQVEWPESDETTEKAAEIFDYAMAIMGMYRGHPDVLIDALRAFVATACRPYAYAGAAYVLSGAAYLSNQEYDLDGIKAAMGWLERAQEIEPDSSEINLIEAILYLRSQRPEDARTVLDHVGQSGPHSFCFCMGEFAYWDTKHDITRCRDWSQRAMLLATHDIQRLQVLNKLAGAYMRAELRPEAIGLYEKVVEIDANDAWAWHNMSVMYLDLNQLKKCDQCNKRALKIMEFGAAQNIKVYLDKKRGFFGGFRT